MKMATKKTENENEMKLEEALRRLDEVVSALEGESEDLEKSLKLYEEGVRLVRICTEKLGEAERKVNLIRMNFDGELVEEEFGAGEKNI